MNKASEQTSMNINGGCTVIARSSSSDPVLKEPSKPNVKGIIWTCPIPKHTTTHTFDGISYDYRYGDGRRYRCPKCPV